MPKLELALEENTPKDLRIEWPAGLKGAAVTYREQDILKVEGKKALLEGASATLPDGSTLSVRLVSPFLSPALEVLRNGFPVPGSHTHPTSRIKTASTLLYVIAVLTLLSGFASGGNGASDGGALVGLAIEAVLYAVLAFFTRKQNRWALYAGTGLYTLDSVLALVGFFSVESAAAAAGGIVGFVLWRTLFFTILGRGIKAFRDLGRLDPNAAVAVFR